jgi:hypothetical protein
MTSLAQERFGLNNIRAEQLVHISLEPRSSQHASLIAH